MTGLPELVFTRAASSPAGVAMRRKENGVWRQFSWSEYADAVRTAAHALLALGVEPGDRVAIHSENRPEWLITDVATVAVRGITVGLYPTNPAPEVEYLLTDSGAVIEIVEDQEQLDKVLELNLPELRYLVYLDGRGITGRYDDNRLLSWEDFLARGLEHRSAHPEALEQRRAAAVTDDVITLVYTSGTTGPPKGAMLTAGNVAVATELLVIGGGIVSPPATDRDLILSYLPLCHVAERFFTTWQSAATGVQVNFAEDIDAVPTNLREVQPTLAFGVPRIWEKLLAGTRIRIESATPLKRAYGRFWLRRADWLGERLAANHGRHTALTRLISFVGHVFFFRALRERLGLRYVRHAASGAAPIAPEVLRFFMGIGVPMHEVYGMTENTAVATSNRPGRIRLGTVGEPIPGIDVRIDDVSGEIQVRHQAVFAGYWQRPDATADTFTPDGWLRTGDVGEGVEGTYIKITDRMKDIIITAGGKNISPSEIENALKASPFIKEAVVIGDGRKFLTALIGVEFDTVGQWASRQRLAYTTYRDLSEQPEVRALVQGVVDGVNARFAQVEQIKAFALLPKELDHEDGELTATQKVKRSAISATYSDVVDQLYGGAR